jgi:hypothetical protein
MSSEWRKSTYSGGANNNCVECGINADSVLVRDTTNRDGFTLIVSPNAWLKFINAIR